MSNPALLSGVPTTPGDMRFRSVQFLVLECLFIHTFISVAFGNSLRTIADFEKGWNELLVRYVDSRSFVHYREWKSRPEDLEKLENLIAVFGEIRIDLDASNDALLALLINAYNAFTIDKILKYYPVDSTQSVAKFFNRKDYKIAGETVSLSDIENRIRKFKDGRIHAALFGGSKSAPPLKVEAFTAEEIDRQLDVQMRAWLSDGNLNAFDCSDNKVDVSKVFLWYKNDFGGDDRSLVNALIKFGPEGPWKRELELGRCGVDFKNFDGTLNDASVVSMN